MPEAPVHEDDGAAGGEHEVRDTGEVAPVKPIAIPKGMDQAPDSKLRPGILRANERHSLAPGGFGKGISHNY